MIKYVFFFYKKIVLTEVSFTSTNTIYYRPKEIGDFFKCARHEHILTGASPKCAR